MKKESYKKRFWLTTLAALSIGAIIGSCKDEFDEVLGICPEVESTNPVNEAIGVQLNNTIDVTFNMPLNPASVTPGVFSLRVGSTVNGSVLEDELSGELTYEAESNTMSFMPSSSLTPNTTYTGRVEPVVKDMMGNALQTAYVWTFTTGETPTVISTDPVNLATGIPLNKDISATFSMAMDSLTITAASYQLMAGTTKVSGEVVYSGTTATFSPTDGLLAGTTYTGIITIEAKNKDGIPLAVAHNWTFDTGTSPKVVSIDPLDLATSVTAEKTIRATFSEKMDPATISTATFTVKMGLLPVAGSVTYSDSTAIFTPSAKLLSNTEYTVSILKLAKSPNGVPMASDFISKFTTGNFAVPEVTTTDPANNATGVAFNKAIRATFTEAMDPATITATTFTVKQGNTTVAGTVSYSGTTATFTPTSPLASNLVYTGTITTGAKNVSGTALASNFVWTFTTVSNIAPTVLSTDPVNNATGVALNKVVGATFSVPMDPATITGTTFTVKQGTTAVAGTVSYSGTTATFTPTNPLSGGLVYTGTITTGAKNAAGTALADNFVWTFTTAANVVPTVLSTDPVNNATNVALNKVVGATFSTAMDPATITSTTFTVRQGNTAVAGTVSYSGTTATFTPTNPLSGGLVYTGTITSGAKNAAGTALADNFVWTFTTAANVVPTVLSTDPVNNATNVALNKVVGATFSTAMDPATITGTTFTVKQGNTAVAGTVSYSGTTALFTPTIPLSAGLVYTGTITTGAENVAGTGLGSNFIWSFTTVAPLSPLVISTDPLNNATNVARNKVIAANFSMPMDPASINGVTFTLQQNGNNVAGNVSYNGITASFSPSELLLPNILYTATITTGATSLVGTMLVTDHVWNFRVENPISPYFVDLKTAGRFGIFAATGVSNNAGFSEIRNLDVGITPGARSSVTGFPPALMVNGDIYASDDISPPGVAAMLNQAKLDLTAAYLFAEGATTPAPATVAGDQGGTTLAPGIYKSNSTLLIQAGDLTLDAQGDPNAVWIFQISAGFTTVGGAGGNIILTGGAQAKNIFWQVGSSATIGDNTIFKGNVLAYTSITMNSEAKIEGRMLVLNGAVVMTNTNIIEKP
ncbi:Ig-like domain-containing protein [Lunatibacter salilacus]|uniref:Ig-like domain-containing protein n=1 Tax=Lunatibacter salilacus TaxID=2483804 RepID=UPI00131B2F5D|nr:Ig-like domain-containing protein [Lunatibacter salilacus]